MLNKLNALISFIDFGQLFHIETPLYFIECLVVSSCLDFVRCFVNVNG